MNFRKLSQLAIVTSLITSSYGFAREVNIDDLDRTGTKVNEQVTNRALYGQGYESEPLGYYAAGGYISIQATPGATTTVSPIISNLNPSEGSQHLRLIKEPAYATSVSGARVAIGAVASIPEHTNTTSVQIFSFDFNNSIWDGTGADTIIDAYARTGNSLDGRTWLVDITYQGGIRVIDDTGGGPAFVNLTLPAPGTYNAGEYYNFMIVTDPGDGPNGSIKYYLNGNLLYTGVGGLFDQKVSDYYFITDDNWQIPNEWMDIDNIIIDDDYHAPAPDLALTKTNDTGGSQVGMGAAVTYTLTVENVGVAGTSTSVVLTDNMPAGMTFGSATCDDGTTGVFSAPTITFSLQDIANAATTVCTVNATVNDFGDLVNNASVTSAGDVDATNDTASSTVIGPAEVDMSITKTSDVVGQVNTGDTVIYTLTVNNNDATDAASNVVVTDALPSQVTYGSNDCGASEAGGTITWNVGSVAASSNAVCNITVTISGFGTFNNTATVAADETDNTPANNSDSASVEGPVAAAGVDLALVKTTSAAGQQSPGATVNFTLTVTNNSSNTSNNTVVTDNLPAGLDYSSNDCGASAAGGMVTWTVGTLAANASSSCNISTTVSGVGLLTNTASVTSDEVDNNTLDNSDDAVVQGPPAVDLAMIKTVAVPDPLAIGDNVVYTLRVNNVNTGNASNVVVTDNLPANVTYVSNTCGAAVAGSTFTWNIGNLGTGGSITCDITVTVDVAGNTNNSASVSTTDVDINAGNDTDTANFFLGEIITIPTLSILSLLLMVLTLGFLGRKMLAKD